MLGWTGWRKRMEKKLDDALALLRASAEREEKMEEQLKALQDAIAELNTVVIEVADDYDKMLAEIESLKDDPAAVQAQVDALKETTARLRDAAAKYPVPAPEPPAPPAPEA